MLQNPSPRQTRFLDEPLSSAIMLSERSSVLDQDHLEETATQDSAFLTSYYLKSLL